MSPNEDRRPARAADSGSARGRSGGSSPRSGASAGTGRAGAGKAGAGRTSGGKTGAGKTGAGKTGAGKAGGAASAGGTAGRTGRPGRAGTTRSASGGQGPQRGFAAGGRRTPAGARGAGGRTGSAAVSRSAAPDIDVHDPAGVRLQKLLAAAGVGSRRVCEKLIVDGRVEVDGHVVRELGVRIDPIAQAVHVDGTRVQLDTSQVYFAFNKPLGVVSTMSDELGRPCVGDYVAQRAERLFHVGRLDSDTEGLILLTNDGELSHRLQHPSYEIPKTYIATVPGPVARDVGRTLREGVELEDGPVRVDSFRLIDSLPGRAIVEVILHEGRKHVVRRLLEAVGHPVETLSRVQVGPVHLRDLKSGRMRPLNGKEVAELYKAAGL